MWHLPGCEATTAKGARATTNCVATRTGTSQPNLDASAASGRNEACHGLLIYSANRVRTRQRIRQQSHPSVGQNDLHRRAALRRALVPADAAT